MSHLDPSFIVLLSVLLCLSLLCVQETVKELEGKVHLLQSGTMELQRAQDLQALEISSAEKELAIAKENNIILQEENQVNVKTCQRFRRCQAATGRLNN